MTPSPSDPAAVLEPWIVSRLASPHQPGIGSDEDMDPHLASDDVALSPAAVLIPLVERDDGLNVILTRRADTLSLHSGQVAFPGGRAEPGETPAETALREAHEEIALQPGFVRVAGLAAPYRTITRFEITPVVGFLSAGFVLAPAAAEVAEVFETPFAFLMDPANHERRHHAESGRRYYAMPYQDWLIWGATAGILRGLYEQLFGEPQAGGASITQPI